MQLVNLDSLSSGVAGCSNEACKARKARRTLGWETLSIWLSLKCTVPFTSSSVAAFFIVDGSMNKTRNEAGALTSRLAWTLPGSMRDTPSAPRSKNLPRYLHGTGRSISLVRVCVLLRVTFPQPPGLKEVEAMSIESTRKVVESYLRGHSLDAIGADAVFTVMASGQEAKGHEAIAQLLDYFYHQAFDANAVEKNLVIGDGQAVLEADFTGKHVGEFAGVAASGKVVHVPLCVAYEIENNKITKARIYFEMDAFRQQVA